MEYTQVTPRHFYRCLTCLEVFAVDGPELKPVYNPETKKAERGRCDCGGLIDHMGRVAANQADLEKEHEYCPCDARCTHAKGPECNCKCHGANHGTGAVIKVTVVVGQVPKIYPKRPLAERLVEVAEARAAFAAAFERIDAKTGGAATLARQGKYIQNRAVWWEQKCLRDNLKKAACLKTHAGRLKAMAKVAAVAA